MTMSPQLVVKVILAGLLESGEAAGAVAQVKLSGRAATAGVQVKVAGAAASTGDSFLLLWLMKTKARELDTSTNTTAAAIIFWRRTRLFEPAARRSCCRSYFSRANCRSRWLLAIRGVYSPPIWHGTRLPKVFIAGFPAGPWATNCYVIASAPGEPCLIVDPGQGSIDGVAEIVREQRLLPVAVLLTHGHIDHVWSVAPVASGFGIPALIHADDRYRLADPISHTPSMGREQLLAMTKGALELTEPDEVRVFNDQDVLDFAGLGLRVEHAPGHTEGSVVFQIADLEAPIMLSGDLLFAGSIGRTDLPGGDQVAMERSLARVVLGSADATVVLPGHGPQTTIGVERATNPYLLAFSKPPMRGM
jgi:hydroxyacylglutathione hydrolase